MTRADIDVLFERAVKSLDEGYALLTEIVEDDEPRKLQGNTT